MVEVNFRSLVMAHSERVAFGLSLASSSSELMNATEYDHLSHISWYFSVLVGQLLEDSSAAISVLQLPLLFFLHLFYAVRDSLCQPLKRVGDSRSCFPTSFPGRFPKPGKRPWERGYTLPK